MKTYALTRASRPSLRPGRQAFAVYGFLEPYGSSHSFDSLVANARDANYEYLFKYKGSTTIDKSLRYHLNRFIKAGHVIVSSDY